jgi:DNA replication and repair protein RecF
VVINKFCTDNFKNLKEVEITPHKGFNLFLGDNAQGKTNLLENIFILTGCKSFRTHKERDFPRFGENLFETSLVFENSEREQSIEYVFSKEGKIQRNIKLNGVKTESRLQLFEQFKCIVFTPEDTELVTGQPNIRRLFIDYAVAQLKPSYNTTIVRFNNILKARNEILKKIDNPLLLEVYDTELVKYGIKIYEYRRKYIDILKPVVCELYSKITNDKEKLNIFYAPNVTAENYECKLKNNISNDLRVGFTTTGVNRDELGITINGKSAKDFASSGQRKSVALVLKLAVSKIFGEKCGETPVILLDDVMAELDKNRCDLIYETVKDCQCFITACKEVEADKVFCVKNGVAAVFKN